MLDNYVVWAPPPPFFTVIEYAVVTSPLGTHDVAVINVTTSKTGCLPMPIVCQNFTCRTYVTIENQGDFTETFKVTVSVNSTSVGSQNVTLSSGNSTNVVFTWDTTGFAFGNYTISAIADTVFGETETADNTFVDGWVIVTIVGDVNGDGKVDLKDVFAVALAYGSYQGHPKYSPNLDINDDDKIDLKDYYPTVLNYGKP